MKIRLKARTVITILLLSMPGIYYLCASFTVSDRHNWGDACKAAFLKEVPRFVSATASLKAAIEQLRPGDSISLARARQALKECRLDYKQIEYYEEKMYAFPVNLYNAAPVYEIEEPYMEYQSPVGLQVIENLLYTDTPFHSIKELKDQANTIHSSAKDIVSESFSVNPDNIAIGQALNDELIRIMTLGISGYDAPIMKTGIQEALVSLHAVQQAYQLGIKTQALPTEHKDSIERLFSRGLQLLREAPSFDKFDRMGFLTDAILPLQGCLNKILIQKYPSINDTTLYNYTAHNLFAPDALKKLRFDSLALQDTAAFLVQIGEKLFSDPILSGNNQVSCQTCHKPDAYFEDGLKGSITFDKKGHTSRNAPTLLYAVYQYKQFWDGRDSSFTKQVYTVLQNPNEMHSQLADVALKLNRDTGYRRLFGEYFSNGNTSGDFRINIEMVAHAISAYERTLTPFNSAFDRYIAGETNAMTPSQINGFNLFMGKAQCGTCHFAPIFNGALPPVYDRTENEILGLPGHGKLKNDPLDTDKGKAAIFPIEYYLYSFKTPTVRNAARTAPYMHNGAFRSLKDVIEFYDLGGGKGIGLTVPGQTLSSTPLHLTSKEKKDLEAFINTLTDEIN